MPIQRDDVGLVAERRGLGKIYQEAVNKSLEAAASYVGAVVRPELSDYSSGPDSSTSDGIHLQVPTLQ